MPARDFYHDLVKAALIVDGWNVTHDPYTLEVGNKDLFVDLGAERLIAADKHGQKIAVEVKSFLGPSEVRGLGGRPRAIHPLPRYHGRVRTGSSPVLGDPE